MQINDVLFTVDAVDIITELQYDLHSHNIQLLQLIKDTKDNVQVQCPYHKNGQERRPSAGIRKSDGVFHCFACGETHSLPELISNCFGYQDLGAYGWSWLLKKFLTVGVNDRNDIDLDFGRTQTKVVKQPNIIPEATLAEYRYYHPYMFKRGLNEEVIEIFDIGYDSVTDCITFPVRDIWGNCTFVARRSVKTKFFNYPAGAEKPLYGLYELYQLPEFPKKIYICESMIDCCLLWKHHKYAVALNGLGNDLQFKQLNDLPCREFVLATDNDFAGMNARKVLKSKINNRLITEVIIPDTKKDIGECTDEEIENLREIF